MRAPVLDPTGKGPWDTRQRVLVAYFTHITRACAGVVFSSVSLVRELIEKASTKTGLKVTADILDGAYEAGRTVTRDACASLNIEYDSTLPSWNYSIHSRSAI
ncbi:MAG TPA: hypothetical protein VNO24_15110 [Blastocatellia bacterium]|nr:hypothetical protein [Blastocatellia bacterium]